MKFLADESCTRPVILALRNAGHDVTAISEVAGGATDDQVLERASSEARILITEDRDFGNLVFGQQRPSPGVMLVKFQGRVRSAKAASVVQAVTLLGSKLQNAFVVVQPGRVRVSTRP